MNGGANGGLTAWLIDAAAASALAAAAGVCGLWLVDVQIGMLAASVALVGGLWSLRQIAPEPFVFKVPSLVLAGWSVVLTEQANDGDCLELTNRVDPEQAVPSPQANTTCLQLPLPTPGEMQRRIERHLSSLIPSSAPTLTPIGQVVTMAPDASAALRSALGELRRSTR